MGKYAKDVIVVAETTRLWGCFSSVELSVKIKLWIRVFCEFQAFLKFHSLNYRLIMQIGAA